MKHQLSVKQVVAIGIGSAVFFILRSYVSIPVAFIPNTTIQSSYPFLALMSVLFGPIVGFTIGLIGHALNDAFIWGGIWWTWVAGSAILGALFAYSANGKELSNGEFGTKAIIRFNIIQVLGNFIVWGLIAPIGDIIVYSEPVNRVFTQGIFAGITNAIAVGIIGTILLKGYASTRTKKGSLTQE